jgi:tripartite-type tricarboxylate transporter receptor subunit TctC
MPAIAGSMIALSLGALPAQAQSDADFFKGKTITIVVGSTPGGGYDAYARTLARYYGAHIPGQPSVVVQNMPGGGSLTSVVHLDSGAPKDGTVITIYNSGLLTQSVTEPASLPLKFSDVAWVGSAARDIRTCYVWSQSGISDWAGLAGSKQSTFGATGANSGSYNDVIMLHNMFGRNVRPILGYPGRTEVHLAIEGGELDGECGSLEGLPDGWLRDRKITVLIHMLPEPMSTIPYPVPYIGDFTKTEDEKAELAVLTAASELGRPFVVSKRVPADHLAILRTGFDATMKDKDFIAFAEKQELSIDPVGGVEAEAIIERLYKVPQAVAAKAKAMITP